MHGAGDVEAGEKICLECNQEFSGIITNCPHDNSLLFTRAKDHFVGTVLDNAYEIQAIIGQGGMGIVYRARHKLMDRIVAVKMLQSQLTSDSVSVKRFQHEAKAASRLDHPNVIKVSDFGISPTGQPYIVMDYLEGTSLADVIKKSGHVCVERTIRIISQACDALDHAHQQGLIHRDLKPTNIVLVTYDDEKDFVKVVDFGVAKLLGSGAPDGQKLTQTGAICGSPVYMSPEQCLGLELDARSDIYSMGVVLYETLSGKLPILGKTMVETMSKHINEMPPRFAEVREDLYIPERLETIIFKAMSKDPSHRYNTMGELRSDLQLAMPHSGRSAALRQAIDVVEPAKPGLDPEQISKIILTVVSVFLILAMGVGTWAFVKYRMNPPSAGGTPVQQPSLPEPTATPPAPQPQATTPPPQPATKASPAIEAPPAVSRPIAPPAVAPAQHKSASASTKPAHKRVDHQESKPPEHARPKPAKQQATPGHKKEHSKKSKSVEEEDDELFDNLARQRRSQ